MKTSLRLAALLTLALGATAARAETRIGFVAVQRAVSEVEEGKAALAVLKKDLDEKQKQLDAKKTEFDRLRGDFDKQASVMSEETRKTKGAELDRKLAELQQLYVSFQKDVGQREQEALRGISDKMTGVVREVAEANGIGVVLHDAAVIWSQQSLDLTNEVIRRYNAKFPAKGGASAKAPAKDAAKAPAAPPAPAKK